MKHAMPKLKDFAADWDESKHPRAADGKFGEGSGGKKPMNKSEAKAAKVRSSRGKRGSSDNPGGYSKKQIQEIAQSPV